MIVIFLIIDKQVENYAYAITRRKKEYSVVSVAGEYSCGFLIAEVVPIAACS
jgi:hypothetical protein